MVVHNTHSCWWWCWQVVILCSLTTVLAVDNGGILVCPDSWIEGEEIELTFFIDRSKYHSVCTGGYSRTPAFERSEDGLNYISNCSVINDITQAGSCINNLDVGNCGCTHVNASYYEIKYKLQAHSDYNGWWRPDLSCFDLTPAQVLTYTTSSGCSNLTVESTTQAPPTTAVPQDDGNTTDEGPDRTAAIAGGVCGGLVFVGCIVGLWFLNAKYKWVPSLVCCCKGKFNTSAPDSGDGKARELMNGDKQGAGSGANTTSSASPQ